MSNKTPYFNEENVLKLAIKLNKFEFKDLYMMANIEKEELVKIINRFLKEKILRKKDDGYLFLKSDNFINIQIAKELEAVNKYQNAHEKSKSQARRNYKLIKLTEGMSDYRLRAMTKHIYATDPTLKVSNKTLNRIKEKYEQFGIEGIINGYVTPKAESPFNEEVLEIFMKYYLTTQKLTPEDARNLVRIELHHKYPNERLSLHSTNNLMNLLEAKLSKEQINNYRNYLNPPNIKPKKTRRTVIPEDDYNITFPVAVSLYLDDLKKTATSQKYFSIYSACENYITPYFRNYTLGDIDPKIVDEFRAHMFEIGLSKSAATTYCSYLKRILKMNKWSHPLANTYTISHKIAYLEDSDVFNLLEHSKYMPQFQKIHPIIFLVFKTGLNLSEILALKYDDIDFENKFIYVKGFFINNHIEKHRHHCQLRKIYLCDKTIEMLNELKKNSDSEFVFLNQFEKDNQYEDFLNNYFYPLAKSCWLNLKFSALRDTHIILLIKRRVPIMYIKKQAGISSIEDLVKTYKFFFDRHENYYDPFDDFNFP